MSTPPTHQDGTPILGSIPSVVGTSTIYDWIYPTGLDPTKQNIWYDLRPVAPTVTNLGAPYVSGAKGVKLPNGQTGEIVAGPTADGSPLVKMPDGSTVPLSSLKQPGMHNVTPADVMNNIAEMQLKDPNGFKAIQTLLSSGVWGTVHVNGSFDHETEVALGNAMLQWLKLTRNTSSAIDFKQYLQQAGMQALQLGNGSGGSTQQPFQASLTDPNTIRDAAMSAAQAALGEGVSKAELNKFVQHFQDEQYKAQLAAYNGTAPSYTAPDLSAQAMAFAQKSNPQEYKANQRQTFMDLLVNMFAPSGSQRPNMTPVPEA